MDPAPFDWYDVRCQDVRTFLVKQYMPGTADMSCPAFNSGTALSAERAGLHNMSQSPGRWKPRGPATGAALG